MLALLNRTLLGVRNSLWTPYALAAPDFSLDVDDMLDQLTLRSDAS